MSYSGDHASASAAFQGGRATGVLQKQVERLQAELDDLRDAVATQVHPGAMIHAHPQAVRATLRARRKREAIFGQGLFADPAWDILLEAYASKLTQRRVSVGDLCKASAVPNTTALRWVAKLEQDGWLRRHEDPLDRRRCWVALTERGISAMERVSAECPLGWPI